VVHTTPATQEVEIGGSMSEARPMSGQKARPYLKNKLKSVWAWWLEPRILGIQEAEISV
jgi:hypothetical protein